MSVKEASLLGWELRSDFSSPGDKQRGIKGNSTKNNGVASDYEFPVHLGSLPEEGCGLRFGLTFGDSGFK